MKYNEYKEQQKAFGKINGIFTFIAYVITFRTKEALGVLAFLLAGWIVTIIINPAIAASVKKYLIGLLP